MADKIPYTLAKPARLLFSSITQKSAPRTVANATPKFSGIFGVEKEDFDALIPLMVQCITAECGGFSGNPNDYYLACMSGTTAAARVRAKAELDCMGKGADEAFKIREKAEKKCAVYQQYAGILTASSQYEIELARLDAGKVVDIKEEHARAQAGKDLFFTGAYVVPRISLQGFRRKTLDAKDGVTSFLQNVLFIRKGEKIDLGGSAASNQEVFGGFANYSDVDPTALAPGGGSEFNYQPQGGTPNNPPPPANAAPPPPPADPNRPADPAYRHDNGDGTEQWHVNGAWDNGKHPIPSAAPPPPASPPPPANPAAPGPSAAAW